MEQNRKIRGRHGEEVERDHEKLRKSWDMERKDLEENYAELGGEKRRDSM